MLKLKQEGVVWGYDIPYLLTGILNSHPSAAIKFIKDGRTDYCRLQQELMDAEQIIIFFRTTSPAYIFRNVRILRCRCFCRGKLTENCAITDKNRTPETTRIIFLKSLECAVFTSNKLLINKFLFIKPPNRFSLYHTLLEKQIKVKINNDCYCKVLQ